ncbi:MAG TPA: polymer-forming cytoskeletal protein [Vicinamibacterales bacterium]|nr:polymer-forming cytoskeletal protein [Vicinamibacterales bacterium]
MQNAARKGSTLVIRGEITAQEALTIAGQVDGTIDVAGHIVTVEEGAVVAADISAAAIVVCGRVQGTLAAATRIHLQSGAEVQGSLNAPRLAVEDGAVVQGKVLVEGQERATMVA